MLTPSANLTSGNKVIGLCSDTLYRANPGTHAFFARARNRQLDPLGSGPDQVHEGLAATPGSRAIKSGEIGDIGRAIAVPPADSRVSRWPSVW